MKKKVAFFFLLISFLAAFTLKKRFGEFTVKFEKGKWKVYQKGKIFEVFEGKRTYALFYFKCNNETIRLRASYDGLFYRLFEAGKEIYRSSREIYSLKGFCFSGTSYIVFGVGKKLVFKKGEVFLPVPVFISGAVQLYPELYVEGNRVFLKWRELKGGELNEFSMAVEDLERIDIRDKNKNRFVKKEKISPIRTSSFPFWFNYSLDANKYVAFGDSITYGCGYGTCDHDPPIGYPPRLENILNQELGYSTVVNRGVPGETTFEGVERIKNVLEEEKARYILIMEGTNDVVHSEYPVSATEENLRVLIESSMKYGTYPLLATIIPRKDWFWYNEFFRKKLQDIVEIGRKLAKEYSIPLADFYKLFMDYEGGWQNLLSDGNHPTIEGYQMMAEEWAKQIKTLPPYPPTGIKTQLVGNLFYLIWQPNEESDLAGYMICYDKVCVDVGLRTSLNLEIEEVFSRTFYLKAYDKAGNISDPSVEVSLR